MREAAQTGSISRVLITGGRETGGLQSFAWTLAEGFRQLGLPAETLSPRTLLHRRRDLRNSRVLKILSTTAVFAAPFARQAICVAHGFPRQDAQGWKKVLALIGSFRAAALSGRTPVVAVSHYTAVHLRAIYNVSVDAVIHNPLHPSFLVENSQAEERCYLTYVGRLHPMKNIQKLLPGMRRYLDEHPGTRVCLVGDGALRIPLQQEFGQDSRVEFRGELSSESVRGILQKTRVFLSGAETESFGIAYLEALSQGCSVVMPACGGGLEIAPELIGKQIQVLLPSFETEAVITAIRRADVWRQSPTDLSRFEARRIAAEYLRLAEQACCCPAHACRSMEPA